MFLPPRPRVRVEEVSESELQASRDEDVRGSRDTHSMAKEVQARMRQIQNGGKGRGKKQKRTGTLGALSLLDPALHAWEPPPPPEYMPLTKAAADARRKQWDVAEEEYRQALERARHVEDDQDEVEDLVGRTPVWAPFCFFCEYGNPEYDGTDKGCAPFVSLCKTVMDLQAHSHPYSLSLEVARYYEVALRQESKDPRTGKPTLPRLTPQMVYEHIVEHNTNPYIILNNNIRTCRNAITILEGSLVDVSGAPNLRAMDMLKKMVEVQHKLQTTPPKSLLFADAAFRFDPGQMGRIAGTRRIKPILETLAQPRTNQPAEDRVRDYNPSRRREDDGGGEEEEEEEEEEENDLLAPI